MGKLKDELRKKYRTPREALLALGLDEKLLDVSRLAFDGAKHMTKKPTCIEYLAVTRTATALNPLLAMDKKVEYGPIFAGLTTKNVKERKPVILDGLKKALKGKTIAKDASMEHVAAMLDKLEHTPEPKFDESVSDPQHKAMEAAAHGSSNLGIPAKVGEEFADADKGKSFSDMLMDWMGGRDAAKPFGEDDIENLKKMHEDSMPKNGVGDETAMEADDEKEDEEEAKKKKEAEDKTAKDEAEAEKKKDAGAMDARLKGMVTSDQMNQAITAAVKKTQQTATEAAEARAFVEVFVGKLPMALDTAEKIHRAAAVSMEIEGAETIHASALPTLIKTLGTAKRTAEDTDSNSRMALDSVSAADAYDYFPEAQRIGNG